MTLPPSSPTGPSAAPPVLDLLEAATGFGREAGAVLREGYGRAHVPDRKGRIDLVTEFDRRSEALLLERIGARFPGHAVLAEESGAHNVPGADVRWLVDPLDGTTNFAHNYPFFAVSIGVEVAGRLVVGVVFDPMRDELFAAAAGHGATLNGRPMRVSNVETVESGLLVTGFPYGVRENPEPHLRLFGHFLVRAQALRRDGSAALNLSYVACGRFDGFWEGDLAPWDTAAGTVLVREAGGRVTGYRGEEFRMEKRQILATNGRLHGEMMGIIAGSAI
jgi:myo-inositol-1(or 4)-monophosphatase